MYYNNLCSLLSSGLELGEKAKGGYTNISGLEFPMSST